MKTNVLNLANMLTILRIALVPVYLWLFSINTWGAVVLALIVFIIAAVTDLYDGRLARSRKEVTKLGKFLDPLADKFLVVGALVQFWFMGMVNFWLVGVVIIRDVWVTILRVVAIKNGTELKTSGNAKLKTTIQLTVVITTIVFTGARLMAIRFYPEYNGQWVDIDNYIMFFNGLLSIAVIFTLYSLAMYIIPSKKLKNHKDS